MKKLVRGLLDTRRSVTAAMAAAVFAALTAGFSAPAAAQGAYPTKPIRMIVGFAPGGAADVITRVIAQALGTQLGQQVIVDNRPGAEAVIAAQATAQSPPDGYTLMFGSNTALVAVPTRPNPPYDPFKTFTPISSAGQFSMFLAVNGALPVRNVNELLAYAKANEGKLNSASSNSAAELAMVQLMAPSKAKWLNIRYKGDVPALVDLAAGQINMIFTTGTSAPAFVKDGRAKVLLTLQPERSPLLPDVPSAAELGLTNLTILPWAGFFGPADMPPEITEKLSAAFQKVLASKEVKDQLIQQGFEGYGMSPQAFSAFFRKAYDSWVDTIRENNIKFE
ncbi:tripartite tricarboxylate transporter substrate binding protein [soil metagenome]